jgi:hypothetical protein
MVVVVDLGASKELAWPVAEVARSGRVQHVNDLEARFGQLSCGEYPESVKEALTLPITPPPVATGRLGLWWPV